MTQHYLQQLQEDLHFNETLLGEPFHFTSTWGLFSPRNIDDGSRMLLDNMQIQPQDHCLDLGCGYGVLGMVMAKKASQGVTTLIDKDFVAVEYAKKNCQANQLNNCNILLSNGFSHIQNQQFHLIASNLPAKVGNEMLTLYMHDACTALHTGGHFYVVTITGLRRFIERMFKDVFGNYKKLKQGKTYTVAVATKN